MVEAGLQLSPDMQRSHPDLTVSEILTYVGAAGVDFGASGPRETPQWYVLSGEVEGTSLVQIEVVMLDTASVVRAVTIDDHLN